MPGVIESVLPQLEAMNQMYRAAYEAGVAEGRRQVYAEVAEDLKRIQESTCPSA